MAHLTNDKHKLTRGKAVFAERCARCHSSKLPDKAFEHFPNDGCAGPDYLQCWNKYWAWTKTSEFKQAMRKIALADDFLQDNYLSNELRVPVTLLETNACSPLATNTRIHNREHHRVPRQVRPGTTQLVARLPDVARRQLMPEVDALDAWSIARQHRVKNPHVVIAKPEIGEQADRFHLPKIPRFPDCSHPPFPLRDPTR